MSHSRKKVDFQISQSVFAQTFRIILVSGQNVKSVKLIKILKITEIHKNAVSNRAETSKIVFYAQNDVLDMIVAAKKEFFMNFGRFLRLQKTSQKVSNVDIFHLSESTIQ